MRGFIRFQSAVPNRHGRFPGVFALANGLSKEGRLSVEEATWLCEANDRAAGLYPDPTTVVVDCYDRCKHPGARAWFRDSAAPLIEMTSEYLELLDRHGVGWVELRTASPGRITYQDAVQVVAVPPQYPEDWPLATPMRMT